ncbi:MAG: ferrous iron transport protein B [Oscillospiraceae bacterium]|jgi:ferrous iron transport protein B
MDTLNELKPGQSGIIISVGLDSPAVKRRLVDMGLTPGTLLTVRKVAPFGDPIEVNLRGYELSLRRESASQIRVRPPERKGSRKVYVYPGTEHEASVEMKRLMRLEHMHELDEHPPRDMKHDESELRLALVGNPNSGKTTLFNALTGSNQYVGNWPGVTVEKKEGTVSLGEKKYVIVDLPGIYSLSPYSMEELVARDYIIGEHPDAVINIVDATNLERNLYLTMQLLELERPMVVALNFMDEIIKSGDYIDCDRLSKELGVPVLPISARNGENIEQLLYEAHRQMHIGLTIEPDDLYDEFTHEIHHRIGALIHDAAYEAGLPAHWASIKLIEGDKIVEKALGLDKPTLDKVESIVREYESAFELGDRETLIADSRYRFIERVVSSCLHRRQTSSLTATERIDRIVTNRFLAVPIFLLLMLTMFAVTFGPLGSWLSDGVGYLVGELFAGFVSDLLSGLPEWVRSLAVDGVIGGVGSVLTFLPQIALLFFFLSLLEDSGYMARAAFIMDRLLRRFGLSGKAFIPMLMGFGCTVPAVMGARTMESEKDKRMTIMLVPFMSCSAKLPVYGLLAAAFFRRGSGLVVFSLYILGLLMAILSGLAFKKTIFSGEPAPFVMELPPYRLPTARNTLLHVWERVKGFLVRAGTVILVMSVVLWFLQSFDSRLNMVETSGESLLGSIGSIISPALRPLGFGTWQAAVALLTGIIAKESIVASMALFYGFSLQAGSSVIASALSGTFASPLAAYSFLVFVLLYIPCFASLATMRRELGGGKWLAFSILWQLAVAYASSFLVYRIGSLIL